MKSALTKPDISTLKSLLSYDDKTGALTWAVRDDAQFKSPKKRESWNSRYAGKVAGAVQSDGYLHLKVLGITHRSHRIAWAIFYGEWPSDQIDHINGDKTDNRILNLRNVTHAQNGRNQKLRSTNTTGAHGIYWDKTKRKWRAQINRDGKTTHVGLFDCLDTATAARKKAEADLGYHENHGRKSALQKGGKQ